MPVVWKSLIATAMNPQPDLNDVRRIFPGAPPLGSTVRIFCGVTRGGRYTSTCWTDDVARKATVLGYKILFGNNGKGCQPGVLVRVKMAQRHPMIERVHLAYVDCLEVKCP